jgi:uncharacterized membrane protein
MADPTPAPAPTPQPAPQPPTDTGGMSQKEIDDGKVMALLSYLIWIVAIVNIAVKNNSFAIYHGKQATTLLIFSLIVGVIGCIPFLGWAILGLWWIFAIVCVVMGVINAANGVCKPLPLIGTFGENWFKGIQKS